MATNNAPQAKSAKEELLELLKKKPKIYQDACLLYTSDAADE